jgi:hypothetical protein
VYGKSLNSPFFIASLMRRSTKLGKYFGSSFSLNVCEENCWKIKLFLFF